MPSGHQVIVNYEKPNDITPNLGDYGDYFFYYVFCKM